VSIGHSPYDWRRSAFKLISAFSTRPLRFPLHTLTLPLQNLSDTQIVMSQKDRGARPAGEAANRSTNRRTLPSQRRHAVPLEM
jgi:hypothetical protein